MDTPARTALKTQARWTSATLTRAAVHLAGLFPLAELAYHAAAQQLTVNPIQFIEQFFGLAALNLLALSLAVTPLITLTGYKTLGRHSRALGLYTFLYFSLHLLVFIGLDYSFDFSEILRLTAEKPFILAGAAAGCVQDFGKLAMRAIPEIGAVGRGRGDTKRCFRDGMHVEAPRLLVGRHENDPRLIGNHGL